MARRRLALAVPPQTVVRQVVETEREDFGNPGNVWHDVTNQPEVRVGWILDCETFAAPSFRLPARAVMPSVSDCMLRIEAIGAEVAKLGRTQR